MGKLRRRALARHPAIHGTLALVLVSVGIGLGLAGPSAAQTPAYRVIQGGGDQFNVPRAISADGTHIWVLNAGSASVTELDEGTGALVRVVSGPGYQLAFTQFSPLADSISSDGTDVWVVSPDDNSVTEFSVSTGALVRVISGFDVPLAVFSDGTDVWVANGSGANGAAPYPSQGSITELDATTGAVLRVIRASDGEIGSPEGICSDGTNVWVMNGGYWDGTQWITNNLTELDASTGGPIRAITVAYGLALTCDASHVWVTDGSLITEVDVSTGAVLQTIHAGSYGLADSRSLSSDGSDVWVPSIQNNAVLEFDASTGAFVQELSDPNLGFNSPMAVRSDGSEVWVANSAGNSVTAFSARTGQSITFTSTPPANAGVGEPAYTVSATGGGSGNPVVFSIDPASTSACSISGQMVSFTASGTCTVDANQAGNSDYLPAPLAQQSFLVGDPPITFTSTPPSNAVVRGPTYGISATGAPSGVPVVFSSAVPSVCTVAGSTVSFVGAGTCTIDADQAGNGQYLPSSGAQSFVVTNVRALSICATTTAMAGSFYSCPITTTGGPVPAISKVGTLPLGVTFVNNHDGTATIAGTPGLNTGKVYVIKVSAVFGTLTTKQTVSATLTLTVDQPPRFTTTASKVANVGQAFTFTIRTKGYPVPAITLATGALPGGVTFTDFGNGTAVLAGTPAAGSIGTYNLGLTATNGIGSGAAQAFKLVIRAPLL